MVYRHMFFIEQFKIAAGIYHSGVVHYGYSLEEGVQMAAVNQKKKVYSWTVICIWLVLFYPVGIYLMITKFVRDKEKMRNSGKVISGFGWFFIVISVLAFLMTLTGDMNHDDGTAYTLGQVISIDIVYLIIGVPLIYLGRKFQARGKIIERYLPRIKNSSDGSLDDLALSCQVSYEDTCKHIQMMIDKKVLPDSYLDLNRRKLVSPLIKGITEQEEKPKSARKIHVVKCPYCGATVEISQDGDRCDYCDSVLHIS